MPVTDNLFKALSINETANYISQNEDYELYDVLRYFNDNITCHKVRYYDGTEDYFLFDLRGEKL